ncbi:PLC-like phosphodiesterase [Schizophyllum commune Loenen D]|nr:PLC-like phosphodiesterase [Schizophyllum commune Loenen D]
MAPTSYPATPHRLTRYLSDCWGHRGASASFPENTLASFEAAMRDGAEGIESDVHVSLDGVVLMFHDPCELTPCAGLIRERNWYGSDGIEHVRTRQEPVQAIPTFAETVALLMKPENMHVVFDVDIKPQNDPERLFTLLHEIISSYADWQTQLAPRLLLGLWHPRFLPYAKSILPYCRRSYIGTSPRVARTYFWDDCDTFSMGFGSLVIYGGAKFVREAHRDGKKVMVWTVNDMDELLETIRWEVDVVLTDRTGPFLQLRKDLHADYKRTMAKQSRIFLWTTWKYYTPANTVLERRAHKDLVKIAGSMKGAKDIVVAPRPTASSSASSSSFTEKGAEATASDSEEGHVDSKPSMAPETVQIPVLGSATA